MKQKMEKITAGDKSKIDEIIRKQNMYQYAIRNTDAGVVISRTGKIVFTGVSAEYFKKEVELCKKNRNAFIDEKFLKAEFEKYDLISWEVKELRSDYSGKSWSVINTQTGQEYLYGEATYLAALKKMKEAREQQVKKKPLEVLRDEMNKGKSFSSLRNLYARDGRNFNEFLNNYKGKSVSYENVLNTLYQKEFKYPVPSHFLRYMVNRSLPDFEVKFSGYRRNKEVKEVNNALSDGFGVFYKHDGNDYVNSVNLTSETNLDEIRFLKNNVWMWSALIGNGFSFHKVIGKYFFTKAESNTFLNPPVNMSIEESLAFAVAFNASKNYSRSLTVSKISILNTEILDLLNGFVHKRGGGEVFTFNKRKLKFVFDCIRFLAMEDSSHNLDKLSDYADYLLMGFYEKKLAEIPYMEELLRQEGHVNPYIYINVFGRKWTYDKLEELMVSWHHELSRTRYIGTASWEGLPLEDFVLTVNEHGAEIEYHFNQILKGTELQAEGSDLRHCVSSYRDKCVAGTCAIVSMKRVTPSGKKKRILTIEVLSSGKLGQVRGFADRSATQAERSLVSAYARHNILY